MREMKLAFASKEALASEAFRRAHELEARYHGCAQCVLVALMEIFPEIRSAEAFRAASALAGGVGLSCAGSCGALSGGVMAIGLFFGRQIDDLSDPEGRRFFAYRLGSALQKRFEKAYGSGVCKDIQRNTMGRSYRLSVPEEFDAFVKAGGHSRNCPKVVGAGAEWAAEIILAALEDAGFALAFHKQAP
jgi:C_GCAxxG_C_C family probable redox protein